MYVQYSGMECGCLCTMSVFVSPKYQERRVDKRLPVTKLSVCVHGRGAAGRVIWSTRGKTEQGLCRSYTCCPSATAESSIPIDSTDQ